MSHTNQTTHYNFPQFVGTDQPAWLTDVNGAFSSIDNEIYAREQATTNNTSAITQLTANVNTLTSSVESATQDIANLTGRVATVETREDNVDVTLSQHETQISALANQLTNLNATNVSYSNTRSGLVATNVQDAIDEVANKETNYYYYDLPFSKASLSPTDQIYVAIETATMLNEYTPLSAQVLNPSTPGLQIGNVTIDGQRVMCRVFQVNGIQVSNVTGTVRLLFVKNDSLVPLV